MEYVINKTPVAYDLTREMLKRLTFDQRFMPIVDLFCGGCNIIDKFPKRNKKIANDKNPYIKYLFEGLLKGRMGPTTITKDYYTLALNEWRNNTRENFDNFELAWIGFIGSFNFRFYDGGYGGNKRKLVKQKIESLTKQIEIFPKDVIFTSESYENFKFEEKSLIYCDIPKLKGKRYFYDKGFNHKDFYDWCIEKDKEGHYIFISEFDMLDDRFSCIWKQKNETGILFTKSEKLFTPKIQGKKYSIKKWGTVARLGNALELFL